MNEPNFFGQAYWVEYESSGCSNPSATSEEMTPPGPMSPSTRSGALGDEAASLALTR